MNVKSVLRRGPPWLVKGVDLLITLIADIRQTNLMLHAGSMAYMTLGSIVPFLALTFAIVSAFQPLAGPNASWFDAFKSFILENLAPRSGQKMIQFLESFLSNIDVAKIGLTGLITLFAVIVILLRDIEIALNNVWQVPHSRSLLKRFMFFWVTVTLGTLCISVVAAVFSKMHLFGDVIQTAEGMQTDEGSTISSLVNFGATFIFFSVLHKIGPNCQVSMKAAVIGGLVAAAMLRLASWGFAIYSANSHWNQNIYEALAVVPLFLIWLYLGWFVVLFSAIVSWRSQHGFQSTRAQSGGSSGENLRLKDFQVRALLPTLCVVLAGKSFLEANGGVMTGKRIASDLGVPPQWVKESLLQAEKMGLLIIKRSAEPDEAQDTLECLLYPSFPPDRMTLLELARSATEDARQWMASGPKDVSIDLPALMEEVVRNLRENQGSKTLADLIVAAFVKVPSKSS